MRGTLFIAFTLSVTGADILPLSENNHEMKQIANCVVELSNFRKYSKNTFVLYEAETIPFLFEIFKKEIAHLLVDKQLPFIMTNDLSEVYKVSESYTNNLLFVIYHQSCDKEIDIFIKKDVKYIIVFDANILHTKCYNILVRAISEFRIYDVTFVIEDNVKVKFNIVTGVPRIDEGTCELAENFTVKNINACVNGTYEIYDEKYIFPSKNIINLRMCNLNVGMSTLFPHSTIENKKTLKTLDSLKGKSVNGSDIEIMKIFTEHLNATLALYYIYRDEETPYFNHEYIGYLVNGTLDVFAGGQYNIYGDTVEYSGVYSRQSIIWVYAVERATRSWQTLLEKTGGLYIFLIFQVSYSLIWKLLCQFDGQAVSLSDTILYSLGALIGTTSLNEARSFKQKIVNISYLLLCIHLSSYISTQMYYYLTVVNPPHPIKTLDELAGSDRKLYLVNSRKYFLINKKYTSFVNTSRDCEDYSDCERAIIKYQGSTILLYGFLANLQSSTAVNDEARVMRVNEDILVVYHQMIMRKESPLNDKLREVISRLFEAGICDKLYYEAIGVTKVHKAKIAVKNMQSSSYSCTVGCKITIPQMAGAFYLWMIGGILSGCIFIVEILIKRQL